MVFHLHSLKISILTEKSVSAGGLMDKLLHEAFRLKACEAAGHGGAIPTEHLTTTRKRYSYSQPPKRDRFWLFSEWVSRLS